MGVLQLQELELITRHTLSRWETLSGDHGEASSMLRINAKHEVLVFAAGKVKFSVFVKYLGPIKCLK